jgi:phage FluMu gp28-like protein
MPNVHDYFLPYQVKWIRGPHPIVVAEKARRIGWTYASSYRAVERRTRLGTDLFYSSADLTAAREFVEACQRWTRMFRVVARDLGEQVWDEDEGLTAFVLRFENGARIVAGSSNPKFFRGKGGDTDADEFAFHAQPRELYKAMQPAALIWGHQMRVWSTHNGDGSFFHRLLESARKTIGKPAGAGAHEDECCDRAEFATPALRLETGENAPATGQPIRTQRVTLLDAVGEGLVEKIRGLSTPDPSARRQFLEEMRASCPDEQAWKEEYLCQPAGEESALLSYTLIAGCEEANLKLWDEGALGSRIDDGELKIAHRANAPSSILYPLSSTHLYAGFDLARNHDRSVLWILEQVGDVFWTRVVRVIEGTFDAQEQFIDAVLQRLPVRRLCLDSTGMGMMFAERLSARWGHRIEPVNFTAAVKGALALPLVRLFQARRVRIPADHAVREDLHKVRRVITAARNVRFDAIRDADGHADRFWALALAHHAADMEPARLPTVALKPGGW